MKVKILRQDGTSIELDGTPDEVRGLLKDVIPSQPFTISYPQTQPYTGTGTMPLPYYQDDITLCIHEYPVHWYGTIPPKCLKCGK